MRCARLIPAAARLHSKGQIGRGQGTSKTHAAPTKTALCSGGYSLVGELLDVPAGACGSIPMGGSGRPSSILASG